MKRYFLGSAAGWSREERISQRRTRGVPEDFSRLEEFLKGHYGGSQAVITRNGRSALAAGLRYGIKDLSGSEGSAEGSKGGRPEVIVNGFTCRAVVQGVEGAGFRPVFADISRETLNFEVSDLEKCVSEKTRAVIVQNTLGNMVEIKEVEKFARKHKLVVVEDLAHSAGRFYADGREAGTVGEIVVLSFGKEKVVDVVNGGAVVFRKKIEGDLPRPEGAPSRKEVFRARWYPTLGAIYRGLAGVRLNGVFMRMLLKLKWVEKSAEGEVDYEKVGLADFQAKLALAKLKRMKDRAIREFYLVKNRDEVLSKLQQSGYYFGGFWYEKPVAPERYYASVNFPEKECPNAVFVSKHIINFPTCYGREQMKRAREIIEPYILKEEK